MLIHVTKRTPTPVHAARLPAAAGFERVTGSSCAGNRGVMAQWHYHINRAAKCFAPVIGNLKAVSPRSPPGLAASGGPPCCPGGPPEPFHRASAPRRCPVSLPNLPRLRLIDIIRMDPRVIVALADLGISPRYLYWTFDSAIRDLGLNFDRALARLEQAVAPAPQPV